MHAYSELNNDTELKSSSVYNQNSPTLPIVNFEEFLGDNDDITDQDLVAWVSIGCIQFPSSEDIPNAATPTNTARFFLRPFNYFDADPSINSTGAVFIKPSTDKSGSGPPVVASRVDHGKDVCVPRKYDTNLTGTYDWRTRSTHIISSQETFDAQFQSIGQKRRDVEAAILPPPSCIQD